MAVFILGRTVQLKNEEEEKMHCRGKYAQEFMVSLLLILLQMLWVAPGWAEEKAPIAQPKGAVSKILPMVVTAEETSPEVKLTPTKTAIDLEAFESIDITQNVGDYLKNLILFDFRGETDLVPGSDSFNMRSFGSNRFVVAIDGLNLRKTGGRKGSHIVDFAYLPPFLIEKLEVLPGPHWALYPSKAIGGVVDIITRAPKLHDRPMPDLKLSGSYKSYNTQNYNAQVRGSAGQVAYDLGYQYYGTDGYLRNSEAEINTVVGRLGYVIPSGGHLALTGTYSDNRRNTPVNNDPADPGTGFDDAYPKVSGSAFNMSDRPTWDGDAFSFRGDYQQPLAMGQLSTEVYYSEEYKDRAYLVNGELTSMYTRWYNQGAKIQDKFQLAENHLTTFELDGEQCFDGGRDDDSKELRITVLGAGLQHQWKITPHLTLTLGLRYETVGIRVQNFTATGHYITGRGDWIERDFSALLPKSFLTYNLDGWGPALRDTSVSLGVSRIWRAPDYHGQYNPQGRPAGAWLDPEDGVGVDAIFARRLFNNVQMKLSYFYYSLNDYIVSNSSFAQYWPTAGNRVEPGQEYRDYQINLERMVRQGVELELSGNLTDDLSFYLGYAYQTMESKGDEPAGVAAASNEPENRIKAGLRYKLFKGTTIMLDYRYEDEQVNEYSEEVAEDEYIIRQVAMDSYHLFDIGVRQQLFEKWGFAHNGFLRLFINNLGNTSYEDSRGYPSTDRTFGLALSFEM